MNRLIAGSGSFVKQLTLVLSLAGLVIVAVLLIPTKERATMRPTATPVQTTVGIPPIDDNAPALTMTATFAMG
jgi:hypothetical protein